MMSVWLLCLAMAPQAVPDAAVVTPPTLPRELQEPQARPGRTQSGRSKPTREEMETWWNGLGEEEREMYQRRWSVVCEMRPDMREEMKQRHTLLREEREQILENFSAAERQQFQQMDPHQQRMLLDGLAHEALRQRGEALAQRFPEAGQLLEPQQMEVRIQRAQRLLEEERGPQVREEIQRALEQGWIGEAAAAWLMKAPLHEAMEVVAEVRRWQFLAEAEQRGLWEELGLNEEERRSLMKLPARDFFRTLRHHSESPRKGSRGRGMGPPGDRRMGPPGERGSGRPPDGRERPRPPRRDGKDSPRKPGRPQPGPPPEREKPLPE